jgi:hypothetical protein
MLTLSTAREARKTLPLACGKAGSIEQPTNRASGRCVGESLRVTMTSVPVFGREYSARGEWRDPMAPCWNANTYGPRTFPPPRPEF